MTPEIILRGNAVPADREKVSRLRRFLLALVVVALLAVVAVVRFLEFVGSRN
jgi:hypothetical protein